MLIDFRKLFPKYGIKPKGVLHVGANVGEEAPVYHQLGIDKVIWIEANPDIFNALVVNISKYPGQIAFNYCVGDENIDTIFHVSNNGSQSSSVLELGTHKTVHPDVHYIEDIPMSILRIDELVYSGKLPSANIEDYDFLNCDTQGFDLNVIKGIGDLLHNFKWVYVEVNWSELYKGCALFPEVEAYMKSFGFKVAEFKECGHTSWGDCLFIK